MLTVGNASMSQPGGHEDTGCFSPYEGCFDWKGLTEFPTENSLSKFSSLSFIHNPILTLKSLPTLQYLTDLCLDYTLIESLEEARPQPRLTSISFLNSPISKLSFLNIMCIIMFGDSVREVNGNILDTSEIQEGIHLRSCLRTYIFSGYVILSLQPIQLKHIRTQEIKPITPFYSQIAPPMIIAQSNFPHETLPDVMDLPKFRFPTKSEVSSITLTPTPTTGTYHPFSSSPSNSEPKKKKKRGKRKHHKNNNPTYESNTGTFQDNFEYYDNSKGVHMQKSFIPPSDSDDCPTMVAKLILPSNNQIMDSMSSDEGVSGVYSVASHKPKNWRNVLIHHSPSMSRQQLSPRCNGPVTVSEGIWNSPTPKFSKIDRSDFKTLPRYEAPPKTTDPSSEMKNYNSQIPEKRSEIKRNTTGKKRFRYVKRKKSKRSRNKGDESPSYPKKNLPNPPPLPAFHPHLIEAPFKLALESSQNSPQNALKSAQGSSCSSQKPAPSLQIPPAFTSNTASNPISPDNEPASSSLLLESSSYSSSSAADDEDYDSLSTMGSSSNGYANGAKKCQNILIPALVAQKGHSSGYEGDSSSSHNTDAEEGDSSRQRGQLPPPPPLAPPALEPKVKIEPEAQKRASSSDEPPHTILDFGTIKIEPQKEAPKPKSKRKRAKKRAIKKKRSGAPDLAIPSTPVLDRARHPQRVFRAAKTAQASERHVPRVAYEGRTEIYDTEDESSGEDDHPQFRKVNFFKLIGIEPDSDDEYMSGDDLDAARRGSEEEDIDGPEDVIAQLRAQGRARFYQMRTVETSTLEEMEKFVTNYVKANLDRYE